MGTRRGGLAPAPNARIGLLAAMVWFAVACSPSGTIVAEGDGTPVPAGSDRLIILTPRDGITVTDPQLTITGVAPEGSDVVRVVSLGRDEHTTATGGHWSMPVELDPGDNLLTFRLGTDATSSSTLLVTMAGLGGDTASAEPRPIDEPDATAEPDSEAPDPTSTGADLPVKVTKHTSSVARNETAYVTIKASKGASCSIDVVYDSGSSTATGLGDKKADGSGAVTWKWKVGGRTAKGTYPVYVTCEKGDREGDAQTSFRVR